MITIRIPANLRPLTNGNEVIEVEGQSVRDALVSLESAFPALRDRLRAPDGQIRRTLLVFVNDDDIRNCEGEEMTLRAGDEISIVPALAGG